MSTDTNEYVDVNLYINDERIVLKTLKTVMHMNSMFPAYDIDMSDFKVDNINISKHGVDISRTTQEYAKQFNKTIINGNCPYMKSNSDGYSFIGEAFVNFVTALAVYEMFPNETSSTLINFANLYRNNKYISDISTTMGMNQYITKMKKVQLSRSKFERQSASSFKGLVGVMYAENGNSKLTEIMEFVNNCLVPNNKIDFTGTEVPDVLSNVFLIVSCTAFGWFSCFITMIYVL